MPCKCSSLLFTISFSILLFIRITLEKLWKCWFFSVWYFWSLLQTRQRTLQSRKTTRCGVVQGTTRAPPKCLWVCFWRHSGQFPTMNGLSQLKFTCAVRGQIVVLSVRFFSCSNTRYPSFLKVLTSNLQNNLMILFPSYVFFLVSQSKTHKTESLTDVMLTVLLCDKKLFSTYIETP